MYFLFPLFSILSLCDDAEILRSIETTRNSIQDHVTATLASSNTQLITEIQKGKNEMTEKLNTLLQYFGQPNTNPTSYQPTNISPTPLVPTATNLAAPITSKDLYEKFLGVISRNLTCKNCCTCTKEAPCQYILTHEIYELSFSEGNWPPKPKQNGDWTENVIVEMVAKIKNTRCNTCRDCVTVNSRPRLSSFFYAWQIYNLGMPYVPYMPFQQPFQQQFPQPFQPSFQMMPNPQIPNPYMIPPISFMTPYGLNYSVNQTQPQEAAKTASESQKQEKNEESKKFGKGYGKTYD